MNTNIKCILLDDELPGLTYLKMLCEQIEEVEIVKVYNNPAQFLQEFAALDFDLCILDIEMPGINGLQVANLLKGKPVIFTTAYKEYAVDAFDLNAIDYVRKPIQKERLQQAIQKAVARLKENHTEKQFAQLNTNKGKTLLFFDQLLYIKTAVTDSRDKTALLADGNELLLKNISFTQLQEILPKGKFARINKQEIIALRIVHLFSFDEITTSITSSAGQPLKLTLSEAYRRPFQELF